MNKVKKILITGGAGFIGSNLCEYLSLNSDYELYSLDNYYTGSERNHLPNVNYIRGNTQDIFDLVNFSPDIIYHLGEYSRVEQSFEDYDKIWTFNKLGTYAVLEFARLKGAKLIYAGSSTKFGDSGIGKDQSPYAWSKSSNTELVKNYGKWFGLNYAITYFYNAYGKREISEGKYATLIALFCKKMSMNEPLTVVSPGSQLRNFTHIEDIISGLTLVGESGYGDEFGIGAPDSFSVLEIAQMFGGEIKIIPSRQGNRMDALVVTQKTQELGWSAKRSIRDYIEQLRKKNWLNE